ncbi:TetR family transcriptional regulator C-terminal domain-containing protein [Nocardia grenadensis]
MNSPSPASTLTDPELAAAPFAARIDRLGQQLSDTLTRAAAQGDLAAGADPHQEAARLVALANGLGTSVLAGQQNIQTATELVRYHLDQLFPAG